MGPHAWGERNSAETLTIKYMTQIGQTLGNREASGGLTCSGEFEVSEGDLKLMST